MLLGVALLTALVVQPAGPNPSPAEVAQAFYRLANQGKCRDAAKLFTPESLVVMRRALKPEDGFAVYCAGQGGRSPLASLAVTRETTEGERASVEIMRTYEKGDVALDTDELVKRDGTWKLVVGESQNPAGPKK